MGLHRRAGVFNAGLHSEKESADNRERGTRRIPFQRISRLRSSEALGCIFYILSCIDAGKMA